MSKRILMILGIVFAVIGIIVGYFTDILNDIPALASTTAGLALMILAIWKKSEKKNAKTIVSILCVVIGVFLIVFAGGSAETVGTLVTAIIGIVILIAGIIAAALPNKA